ncbi:glycosyltransferase family 39 protein, partial [Patescibacteria group bacterium]|nr:glycosyltransferase family 39 protein [Patescibacteria group bacterium]
LNWDEISHGYNAYSILQTGKDEWGKSYPLIFRAYGDYKLPVYIYLTSLSINLFGLNDFAVRFPSALAGVLSVLFTYLFVKKLFQNSISKYPNILISLIASFFLAISPWHIFLSRPAFEANLASFLVIAGIYFFLLGLEKKWLLPLSIFFLGLSVHTYNSARVFVPLMLAALFFLYRQSIKKWAKTRRKELVLVLAVLALFFVSLAVSFISPSGWARFRWVKILDQGAINRINMARGSSNLPSPLPRLIHNKATYFTIAFTQNYFSNFSAKYLFFKGGANYQYNIPGQGIIYPVQIPLILLGLYWLFKERRQKESKLIFFWWLLAVIPAAATQENPHVLRTILVLPMPQVLAALGFFQFWGWFKRKRTIRWLLTGVYGLLLLVLIYKFLTGYFGSYRKTYSWPWQYGYKQVANYIQEHYNEYEKIFMTKKYGESHEFLLFYLKWAPAKYQQDPNLNRYFLADWYWVDSFDKFVFINDWEVKEKVRSEESGVRSLLITSPGNYPEGWSKLETINFLDGKPAFEILEH